MLPALTDHAILRYQSRVANVPREQIEQAIDTPAFRAAMQIGAKAVILSNGIRAIIHDGVIVTFSPGRAKK